MSGKQKILLAFTLTALLICSSGTLYGYFRLWPKLQAHASTALEDEIASTVQRSMSSALALRDPNSDTVRLSANDLNFSTINDGLEESGFDIVNGDATIYNGIVEIGAGRISFYLADMLFTATPSIHEGDFDLVASEADGGLTGILVDSDVLERGIERGVNAALAEASLQPTSVLVLDELLYVTHRPSDGTS